MPGKGASYERTLCRVLSLWWSEGAEDSLFWRTSQSGGRATTRAKSSKRTVGHCGDICATSHEGEPFTQAFACEVKRGYNRDFDLMALMDRSKEGTYPLMAEWVDQAARSRDQSQSKFWLLIIKRDRRDGVAAFPTSALDIVEHKGGTGGFGPVPHTRMAIETARFHGVDIMLCRLDDFLDRFKPELIKDFVRKHA